MHVQNHAVVKRECERCVGFKSRSWIMFHVTFDQCYALTRWNLRRDDSDLSLTVRNGVLFEFSFLKLDYDLPLNTLPGHAIKPRNSLSLDVTAVDSPTRKHPGPPQHGVVERNIEKFVNWLKLLARCNAARASNFHFWEANGFFWLTSHSTVSFPARYCVGCRERRSTNDRPKRPKALVKCLSTSNCHPRGIRMSSELMYTQKCYRNASKTDVKCRNLRFRSRLKQIFHVLFWFISILERSPIWSSKSPTPMRDCALFPMTSLRWRRNLRWTSELMRASWTHFEKSALNDSLLWVFLSIPLYFRDNRCSIPEPFSLRRLVVHTGFLLTWSFIKRIITPYQRLCKYCVNAKRSNCCTLFSISWRFSNIMYAFWNHAIKLVSCSQDIMSLW